VTQISALSQDISGHREQPKSNASIDCAAGFQSLGTATDKCKVAFYI
jgi:hypothetical protein